MQVPDNALHSHSASIDIAAPPEQVYDLVSDITRMGEWSPEASGGQWHEGATGVVGDWFSGHNHTPTRDWSRECQVARADRGSDFTFVVGGIEDNCTWWSYEMAPTEAGTRLTERWWMVNVTPGMQAASQEQYDERVGVFTENMLQQTIASLKTAAES